MRKQITSISEYDEISVYLAHALLPPVHIISNDDFSQSVSSLRRYVSLWLHMSYTLVYIIQIQSVNNFELQVLSYELSPLPI